MPRLPALPLQPQDSTNLLSATCFINSKLPTMSKSSSSHVSRADDEEEYRGRSGYYDFHGPAKVHTNPPSLILPLSASCLQWRQHLTKPPLVIEAHIFLRQLRVHLGLGHIFNGLTCILVRPGQAVADRKRSHNMWSTHRPAPLWRPVSIADCTVDV